MKILNKTISGVKFCYPEALSKTAFWRMQNYNVYSLVISANRSIYLV